MNSETRSRVFSRRKILKLGGYSALLALVSSTGVPRLGQAQGVTQPPLFWRLAATDGHILLPAAGGHRPLYVFGFMDVPMDAPIADLSVYKGNTRVTAPIIGIDQETETFITVTNIGLAVRFDLDDAHTMHWHGFRNPIALFDGVPETSIAVPPDRDFPYYFKPHDPGTYMYHCHFEDVEHVQMGMNGIVYVRPTQNFTGAGGSVPIARLGGNASAPVLGYCYNDGNGATAYDREFALMLNEIDTRPHDLLESVQEFLWSDYKANYWIINGRAYPDTVLPNDDASLPNQPTSALIQASTGERVLLRFANLGYEQHAMQLDGMTMHVVGHDATLLRGPDGTDTSYRTQTIYIGPGEARDVLFVAPPYIGPGPFDVYLLKNRNYVATTNGGLPGLGGMVTEVRVYPAGVLPQQTVINQTYV